MSELVAGIIGAAVGGFVTFVGEIVRDGIRARREQRVKEHDQLASSLSEVVDDLRELQVAVFAGVDPRDVWRKDRPT